MKRKAFYFLSDLIVLCMGLLVFFPIVYGFLGAFKAPFEFAKQPPALFPESFRNLANFAEVFRLIPLPRLFLNSLIVACFSALVRIACAALAAYAFACFSFRGKHVLFLILLGTMMLPPETLTIGNYRTVARLGLLDTYLGISIVSFVGASQMFMLRQAFLQTDPELQDAAFLDGCGDMRYLLRILLPMNLPILTTLFLQAFVAQWNAYLWPLLVTNTPGMRTVQVGITMLTTVEGTNYETILAGVSLALIPSFLLFFLLRNRMTGSMKNGSLA